MKGWRNVLLALGAALCTILQPAFAGAAQGWPARGEIVYNLSMGNGPQVGEARHSWAHDGSTYHIETRVRTVGMAALIARLQYVQRSEGRVLADGLQPQRFTVIREGRAAEQASFDWAAGQLVLTRKERRRELPLRAATQDVLSLWHQIAIAGNRPLPAGLQVVTGRKAADSTLSWEGEEELTLPLGKLRTRRLKASADDGSMSIEVWFAIDRNMLPVRIRMVDDDGDVLDQQASELRFDMRTTGRTQ